MSDYADRYTDKKISEVDRELKKTYRTAQKQLKTKLSDFNRRFAEKSREKQKQLAAGEITKKEYQDWLTGQVFIRSKINEQLKVVNAVMLDHNQQAINLINTANLDVFAEGYNFSAYLAERDIFASFQVYNTQAVARLILGDPDLLPKWKIDEPKDYRWNAQRVNNIIRQGIIQGKGVPEITDDLCAGLATSNYKKMRMFARTAIGSAEEAGRQKQMNDLAEMGVEVLKKWLATHDGKTRDTHREMDGEEVPYDQPFSNGLMFPKDPTGAAEEIYNCRCVMRTVLPKYENRENYWRENDTIEGQSYEEWKAGKKAKGQVKSKSTVVAGKDITDTWKRNAERFQFGIQDAIHAQGYDGLPTVVSENEFETALKKSGIIAQRGYTAKDKEQLKMYQDALYKGEFFVECKGGSMFGRGMYTAVSIDGTITDAMKQTTEHYANDNGRVETFTFQPGTKLVQYEQLMKEFSGRTLYGNLYDEMMKDVTEDERPYVLTTINGSDDWAAAFESRKKISGERLDQIDNRATALMGKAIEKSREMMVKCDGDIGVFATLRGYDGTICNADKYAVIYNRTKLIIKGD